MTQSYAERLDLFQQCLASFTTQDKEQVVASSWAHLDAPSIHDERLDNSGAYPKLDMQYLRNAIQARSQRQNFIKQEHYGNVLAVADASPGDYIHTDIVSKQQIKRPRCRRFSVDVLTVDGYMESSTKTIPLTGKPREDFIISDPILQLPTPKPWSKDIYFEDSACEISEMHFCAMAKPGIWFDNEIINTSFAILDRVMGCKQHRVSLLDVWSANAIYKYRELPGGELGLHPLDDKQIIEKCKDKDFIIIPISDGYPKMLERGLEDEARQELADDLRKSELTEEQIPGILGSDAYAQRVSDTTGSHWSLLIVDCRGNSLRGRYFDSWTGDGMKTNIEVAQSILQGLFYLLSHEQPGQYSKESTTWAIDENAPKQREDNSCTADRGGACGSFVWAIAKEFAQYIIECREDELKQDQGKPIEIDIKLPEKFKSRWGWNSAETRRAIKNLIERERRVRLHLNNTTAWFDHAGKRGWQNTLSAGGLPMDWFWDPYRTESWFENGAWQYKLKG